MWGTDGQGNVTVWGANAGIGVTVGGSYGKGTTVNRIADYQRQPYTDFPLK